jgi:thioredoxin 1
MPEPTRDEVDNLTGPVVLEFGASWCPHCQAIQPQMAALLQQYPQMRHIKTEDGKGKPLGRSFAVKLWPTLVFMNNGDVLSQIVRPEAELIEDEFAKLAAMIGD